MDWSNLLTLDILNPLQRWLSDLPWWFVAAVVGMVGWVRGGVKRGLLLAACVVLLGLMQAPNGYTFQGTTSYNFVAWNDAMGLPNCTRSKACRRASDSITRPVPTSHQDNACRPAASGTE